MISLNTVGPTLMAHGSQEQKDLFLPQILAGSLDVAIGYTEPGSGTDLASLRTRADRVGDEFVVNGNKVYTTAGLTAEYIWLAARTNQDAAKHKGITIMLVDTKSPGFSVTPIETIGGEVTSATYYEDVHVPASMVVGEVDAGWRLITSQLNHERVALAAMGGRSLELFEAVRTWARGRTTAADGTRLIDVPWVRQALARVYAKFEALKLLNWRMAWKTEQGTLTPADASSGKVFGSEADIECYRLMLEVLGRAGFVQKGSPTAELAGVRREGLPQRARPHLRGRLERGAARDPRPDRPRAPPNQALGDDRGLHPDRGAARPSRAWPPSCSPPPRTPAWASRASTRSCGRDWPRAGCSACPSPRTWAAAACRSPSPPSSPRRAAAPPAACPSSRAHRAAAARPTARPLAGVLAGDDPRRPRSRADGWGAGVTADAHRATA